MTTTTAVSMKIDNSGFHEVTAYWLGDQARFGQRASASVELEGLPASDVVHREELTCGLSVATSHHGLVVVDFSRWDVEATPTPDAVLGKSPFADNRDRADRMHRLGQRVTALNAHQACLLINLDITTDEESYCPSPRPLTAETAWVGWANERVSVPPDEWTAYHDAIRSDTELTIPSPCYSVNVIDSALDRFEAVLAGGPVAVRAGHLLLHAAWHYEAHRFDQALLCAFPVAESMARELWGRRVDEHVGELAESGSTYRMTADRRKEIAGRRVHVRGPS